MGRGVRGEGAGVVDEDAVRMEVDTHFTSFRA